MNKTTAAVSGAAAAVLLAFGGWYGWHSYRAMQPVGQESLYSYDVTDPKKVVPEAQNVFVGEVVEDTGVRAVSDIDSNTYRVRVKEPIKGALRGEATVTQAIDVYGTTKFTVGGSYLFATNAWTRSEDGHAQLYGGPVTPADSATVSQWKTAAGS